jgi:hypothetical protein
MAVITVIVPDSDAADCRKFILAGMPAATVHLKLTDGLEFSPEAIAMAQRQTGLRRR